MKYFLNSLKNPNKTHKLVIMKNTDMQMYIYLNLWNNLWSKQQFWFIFQTQCRIYLFSMTTCNCYHVHILPSLSSLINFLYILVKLCLLFITKTTEITGKIIQRKVQGINFQDNSLTYEICQINFQQSFFNHEPLNERDQEN